MGEKALGIVSIAVIAAVIGDLLAHVAGTNAIFNGIGTLLGDTYKAAGGGYTTTTN